MVAYSCKAMFAPKIVARIKRHTIRADRRRHARPGERIQLFVGMRTKNCSKIIDDPLCSFVRPIMIHVGVSGLILRIDIDGRTLLAVECEQLAIDDGFEAQNAMTALQSMSSFWVENYGPGVFRGVIIGWEDHV